MKKLQILGTGCPKCKKLMENILKKVCGVLVLMGGIYLIYAA